MAHSIEISGLLSTLVMLERRGVITADLRDAETCCGLPRDDDGFCIHRPGHPVYVKVTA